MAMGDLQKARPFGHALLPDFGFRQGLVNLNHGSFGASPRSVKDACRAWQDRIAELPDIFMRIEYSAELEKVRRRLASLVACDVDELVFVQNATTGVNTVLRSFDFEAGDGRDTIVYFAITYGACINSVEYLVDHSHGRIKSIEIPLVCPFDAADVAARFDAVLRDNAGKVKVAILDLIASLPGVKMPWVELVAVCRKHGVLSLVDAAHGIGHTHIDLASADPDFFVSNCHKWLFGIMPTAILHVPRRNQHLVSALPTGHGYMSAKRRTAQAASVAASNSSGSGKADKNAHGVGSLQDNAFIAEFDFPGTVDFAPFLALGASLDYRASLGGEASIVSYCTRLAKAGGAVVAAKLGTEVMAPCAEGDCCMVNVRLPLDAAADARRMSPGARMTWFHRHLADNYNLVTSPLAHDGAWYVRLSAQVYNELPNFEYAGEVLKKVCQEIEAGRVRTSELICAIDQCSIGPSAFRSALRSE